MRMRKSARLCIRAMPSPPNKTAQFAFALAPVSFTSPHRARLPWRRMVRDKIAHVSVSRGTVGFVSVTSAQLELETPVGLVRPANGQRAQGQVTIIGPNQMIVSAYSGAITVERNGESRTVEAGKSYNVSFDPNGTPVAQAPAGAGAGQSGNNNGNNGGNSGGGNGQSNKGQIIFDAIVLGAAAGGGAIIWHYMTESSTSPD